MQKPELEVTIKHDYDAEDPRDYSDFKLYSFCLRHTNYKHPYELGLGPQDAYGDPIVTTVGLRRRLEVGTAFICSYFEHGQCRWWVKGTGQTPPDMRWDGNRNAGLLIWTGKARDLAKGKTAEERYEKRLRVAQGFLETYTSWCNGKVYWYDVRRIEDDESIDSCGGYIGDEGLIEDIKQAVAGRTYRVIGDAAWLADGHNLAEVEEKAPVPVASS